MRDLAFLLLSAVLAAEGETTVVRCGRLLDVNTGQYIANAEVVAENRLIRSVGRATSNGPVIDLSALTCLPGLIDAHDHLTSDPKNAGYKSLSVSVPRSALIGAHNARVTLQAGFTTVRNLGAKGYADVALRDAIDAGEIEGPHLLVSGPALSRRPW